MQAQAVDRGPSERSQDTDAASAAPIRVVLAATDVLPRGGKGGNAVRDAAIQMAVLHGAELRFLYAVGPLHFANAGTEAMAQRETIEQAVPRIDEMVERARGVGVPASWNAREAKVDEAICAEAHETRADLVVVARPRRWFAGRWLRQLRRAVGVPILCVPRSNGRNPDLVDTKVLVPALRREHALRTVNTALRVFSPPFSPASRAGRVLLTRPLAPGDDPVESVERQAQAAGADVIALDARARGRPRGWRWLRSSLLGRLLRRRLSRPLLVP